MVLAHQGGWDEMVFVAVPIAFFAGLLALANKRAQTILDAEAAAAELGPQPVDDGPAG